jgi:hypothetical protein
MEERSLNAWEDFDHVLTEIRTQRQDSPDHADSSSLLFRGQEDSCWRLQTTLDRKIQRATFTEYYRVIGNIRPEIETLTNTEWPIPDYLQVSKDAKDFDKFSMDLWWGKCPGYAYMAYLRHHGFPSPLLDWTRSPYIAAFFAFNKAIVDSKRRVAIYVFGQKATKSEGNRISVLHKYGPHVRTHRRHVLQQSEYTLCTIFDSDNEFRFANYDTIFEPGRLQQGFCWKITLPATERTKVLGLLDSYNVNAFSLFGSEDSMMEMLATKEFDFTKSV